MEFGCELREEMEFGCELREEMEFGCELREEMEFGCWLSARRVKREFLEKSKNKVNYQGGVEGKC